MVASLPDISEFNLSLSEWKAWFLDTAALILSKCPDDGVVVFYQSDIKMDGIWVDKSYLCQKAAESVGSSLLWHKIACRTQVGSTTFGRPAYSHVLCFSKSARVSDQIGGIDVLPDVGEKTWQRGMGLQTCLVIAKFLATHTATHTVIHPFCGEGSMLAAANFMGLHAIGVERSAKRAEKARTLKITPDGRTWAEDRVQS